MKNYLLLATLASMTLVANAASPYQDMNYRDWGKLKLVGTQLSSSLTGNPVQLKGWSTYSLHYNEVQGCLGAGQWNNMKMYGANVVRLAMFIDEDYSYLSQPAKFKALVKESIEECMQLNMYCVVDWHMFEDNGHSGNPNDYLEEAKDFFAEISEYCAENGYDNVLYELCNEPTCGWINIKKYAEEVIPVITANQDDAIIIVGTDSWSQNIMGPVSNPINSKYKKNVIYSFHYSACSHFNLLSAFRNAQKNIPVFVSQWSTAEYNDTDSFCKYNSDALIAACEKTDDAPQVVSWCIWNWGKKGDATSFYNVSCQPGNESTYKGEGISSYGDYVKELMSGFIRPICCDFLYSPYKTINEIPTRDSMAWHWNYYDNGGPFIAYYDNNGTAWVRDEEDNVIDYSNESDEVDVYSLAQQMQWLEKKCPWSTVVNGKVVSWDNSINTSWRMEDSLPTYKSLNGGRNYCGPNDTIRPDEGVDLVMANCKGTPYEGAGYTSLGWVEAGEWIDYTVKVLTPGYYKISGVIGAEYKASEAAGEISILSGDGKNLLRGSKSVSDAERVTSFGFKMTTKCADPNAERIYPWDCWAVSDAITDGKENVYCAFAEAGVQKIKFLFNGDAGGVGPLTFDFVRSFDPLDPIISDVDDVNSGLINFTIYPNPTSGEFTVSLANDVEAVVEVVNMAGQVVASQIVDGTATINKTLSPGVYTVVVKSEGAVGTQKLMVK